MRARNALPLATLVALSLACAACQRVPTGEALHAAVNAALDANNVDEARRLLGARPIDDDPVAQRLLVELEIMSGRYREAQLLLAEQPDGSGFDVLREDACIGAALADLEGSDAEGALTSLAPCTDSARIDLIALRLDAVSFAAAPDAEAFAGALDALRAAAPGPEADVAAAALESAARRSAEKAESAGERAEWLLRAFRVGQSPDVGTELVAAIEAAGDAMHDVDPQAAATWYEHLFTARVEGLEVPDDVRRRVEERSRLVLFGTYRDNFTSRYDRKALEDDIAAGIVDATTHQLILPAEPLEARVERFNDFVYTRAERSRPTPTPNHLATTGQCTDPSATCRMAWDDVVRVIYDFAIVEERFAREQGVVLQYAPANEL